MGQWEVPECPLQIPGRVHDAVSGQYVEFAPFGAEK